ncbi:hypothetical protein AWC38_SpisGene24900 [Stylophora pistillata]|uniref:NACHT domain-containing protein n=1 Tax=Stylophora pistillata TaxID=50429 RepID=A0A2B4QYU2_STYPI|nr:hypothetical protein AWC38_SpisGene24900 [Stylophora pistillata]
MTAILQLLQFSNYHPAAIFPVAIQTSADYVRKDVRNKWGHFDVTEWTEAFFNDCLSKLETLVRSLGLTGGMEKNTLDQLSDWRGKGCQLCMGHAVDNDLLSLVKTEGNDIIKDLTLQSAQLFQVQKTGAVLKVRLDDDEATRKKEMKLILGRLTVIEKNLGEEFLRRIQGVEEKVEQLEQRATRTDQKVDQLGQGVGDRMNQSELRVESEKPEVLLFDVQICRSKLAEHYKRTATVPTSVWSKKSAVNIHQIYTRLSWVKEEQPPDGSSRVELNHYTDVLAENKNGLPSNRILVQGQIGIGKSTFVKKLAMDWAELDENRLTDEQRAILKKFELAVVIDLKKVSKHQSLRDVIRASHIFAEEDTAMKDGPLSYITQNQDKVLLVFDGYDEYHYAWNSEIFEIFRGNKLRNCSIVQYILDHNEGKCTSSNFRKVEDFKEILVEIGKVALECLLNDDHVFEYDQRFLAILCEESRIMGLLQVNEYAENIRPAGMVSFIHKSIQEFLAAWYITYLCVPEGNLGEINDRTQTLDECCSLENVLKFICGLSDGGSVKAFERLTRVRVCDSELNFSRTIPDEQSETDVTLCDVTDQHRRFFNLVYESFNEVESKTELFRLCLNCTEGIIFLPPYGRSISDTVPERKILNEVSIRGVVFYDRWCYDKMTALYESLDFLDCLRIPLKITENSAAVSVEELLK